MDREDKLRLGIIFILMAAIILVSAGIKFVYSTGYSINFNSMNEDIENICLEGDLDKVTTCLRDYITIFYNYSLNLNAPNRSIEEIKKIGGDCEDYSDIYSKLLNKRGFLTETPILRTEDSAHMFVLAYDSNNSGNYCLLDQTEVYCN